MLKGKYFANRSIDKSSICYVIQNQAKSFSKTAHVFINKHTKVICQGMTGRQGTFHTEKAIEYGTNMVGGISPKKAGTMHLGLRVFGTVEEAKRVTKCDASVIYIPASQAAKLLKKQLQLKLL